MQQLSDYDLFESVYLKTLELVASYPDESEALSQLSQPQRVFYILSIYDMEMQNGGLCQFFVNSSRSLSPYLEETLLSVGAEDHAELFSTFMANNNLSHEDLSAFAFTSIENYIAMYKSYDFEAYDDAYYELPSLEAILTDYIRANMDAFSS